MIQTTNQESSTRRMYSKQYDLLVRICQFASYWLFRGLSPFFVRSNVCELTPADIKPGTRYVIAANHQTHLDPFVASSLIPYPTFKRLNTLRFFAHTVFFSNVFNRSVMVSLGAFPTKAHPLLPHGLAYASDQLDEGHTVLIFPEGRMTIPGETPAKLGIGIMAQWPNVMVIPIHLDWHRGGKFQRSLDAHIGKPFSGVGMSAQDILDRVFAMPTR